MRPVCKARGKLGAVNRLAERDQPLPAPARRQPGRLVPVGRGGARPRARRGPADPALDRLRRLPLVPRDGARVVRGRVDGGGDERALRQRQGRPRGAPRPRRGLHGGGRGAVGARRLADDRLPDARRRAVLRRHLLPARAPARDAELPPAARLDRGGVARPPRRRLARRGAAGRGRPPLGRAAAVERPAHRLGARPPPSATWPRRSSPRTGAGGGRRSSRTRPRSSSCSAERARRRARWS